MDINKQNNTLFGATNEAILLNVQYEKVDLPSYINIIGFSDIMKENYYPIDFSQYNKNIPKAVLTDVKKMDFFETFKTTTDKNFNGYIVYDSFVTLEGVKFDDGIHQCTLYISDNDR
jgi:hypothetical protein